MPAPTTADSFLRLLDQSGLLPAEAVDALRGAAGTPRQLADRLVADGSLTPFQARQLLGGRHRGFFLTDKYKVLDLLGEGGMGRVLLCEHLMLHKLLAVKVLTGADDVPGAAERFLREARALAALDHPHIARVFDADRTPAGGPFLVMEFVDGTNLHQLVAQTGPVAPGRAAGFARMAALGLEHARQNGLVHRDVKPGNLILDRAGSVKLLDLGLARFFDIKRNNNLTRRFDAKNVLGTADFIAPEQAVNSSNVDTRADVYSLGCTLYYLLAGRFPFPDGQPMEKLVWHQTKAFDPVRRHSPHTPAGLAAVLDRMVQKEPADRYQTPQAAADALAEFALPPAPPPAGEMPRTGAVSYRLGLSPPPSPSTLTAQASPTSPVRRPADSTPLSLGRPAAPPPPVTPRTNPELVPAPRPRGRRRPLAAAGLAGLLLAAGVGWLALRPKPPAVVAPPADAGPLVLAGSTFVRPLVEHWAELYAKETGRRVEYKGVGSPRGVAQMVEGGAAVGLTDVALTDDQLRAAGPIGGPVVHVPLAFGAVAVTYSLPDAGPEPVRVNGAVLADAYRGQVRRWNDPALKALNPGRNLPPTPVAAVRRTDGSGTTALFTGFLRRESAGWPADATGTDPRWPAPALDARGSDGMAALIGRTPGGLGYVEMTFALTRRLAMAEVVNADGRAVPPGVPGVAAAAAGAEVPDDLRLKLPDQPGGAAYPLAACTWAVAYEEPAGGRGPEAAAFLRWAVTAGQKQCGDLHYAPLPGPLAERAAAAAGRIR